MDTRMALMMANVLEMVFRWARCWAEMMEWRMDAHTNWGIHWDVMSASLKKRDIPRADHCAQAAGPACPPCCWLANGLF